MKLVPSILVTEVTPSRDGHHSVVCFIGLCSLDKSRKPCLALPTDCSICR